jgi:hypothetical protein
MIPALQGHLRPYRDDSVYPPKAPKVPILRPLLLTSRVVVVRQSWRANQFRAKAASCRSGKAASGSGHMHWLKIMQWHNTERGRRRI